MRRTPQDRRPVPGRNAGDGAVRTGYLFRQWCLPAALTKCSRWSGQVWASATGAKPTNSPAETIAITIVFLSFTEFLPSQSWSDWDGPKLALVWVYGQYRHGEWGAHRPEFGP